MRCEVIRCCLRRLSCSDCWFHLAVASGYTHTSGTPVRFLVHLRMLFDIERQASRRACPVSFSTSSSSTSCRSRLAAARAREPCLRGQGVGKVVLSRPLRVFSLSQSLGPSTFVRRLPSRVTDIKSRGEPAGHAERRVSLRRCCSCKPTAGQCSASMSDRRG